MSNSVITVRIAGERKRIVERIALDAGSKCGKILKVSDVIHFLIDRYSNLETIEELAKCNLIEKPAKRKEKKMKLKTLAISALLALGLAACSDADISGTYFNDEQHKLTIEKTKDGKKFIVTARIAVENTFTGKEEFAPYRVVAYRKGNSLYLTSDDTLVGKIEKEQFTFSENGRVYKRKL